MRKKEPRLAIWTHLIHARTYVTGSGLGPFLVRSATGSGLIRIAAMLASFGVGVQLARGLGVEGYGYYGVALSIITIGSIPSEFGLTRLVVREVAAADAKMDYAALFGVIRWADRMCLWISAVAGLGIIIAALVVFDTRSAVLGAAILVGLPLITLLPLARIRGGALQGLHFIVLGQIPANLLRPLLLSLLLFIAYFVGIALTPTTAMGLNTITAAAVFVTAHIWLRNRLPATAPAQMVQRGKKWLTSTVPLALTEGMRSLQSELTILLLGVLAVATDVGLFRIAVVTATIATAPMIVLLRVTMPTIARLFAEQDHARLQKLVTYGAYAQTAGVVLLSLPLLIAPELLLSTVFGADFAPAANVLRLVAMGQIANAAFGPNTVLLNMTYQERRVTRAMAIALVLNVTTVLVLTSILGMIGAAVGFVVSLLSWNTLIWLDGRRILAIDTSIMGPILPRPKLSE